MPAGISEVYRGQRVLVLGASGFIGRWVARKLTQAGAELCLAVRDVVAAERVSENYGLRGKFEVVDLENAEQVVLLVERTEPSIVFNLAGYGIDASEQDADRSFALNTRLPEVVARCVLDRPADSWRGQRLVHTGSGIEYGLTEGTLTERTSPAPTTTYGRSKLAGTNSLSRVERELGSGGCMTVRLFTVYGPGEHSTRLLPSLLEVARTGTALALTSGEQRRDFTYVEDVAEGLLRLGSTSDLPSDVVNLATGHTTTVREFAEIGARVLSIAPELLRFGVVPMRSDEMQATGVDVSLLRETFGWIPTTEIARGIQMTRDFEQRVSAPVRDIAVPG